MRDTAGSVKRALVHRYNSLLVHQYNSLRRMPRVRQAKRKIFIDCGANTCTMLRQFVRDFPDFEFFAFEAQPELAAEGKRIIRELPKIRIQHFNKAVWTRDEVLSFYLATNWLRHYRSGSTLMKGQAGQIDYQEPVQVEGFDFSRWLAENFGPDDYVIVKMDIEGAEYEVLEKVIADGNLALIDELFVEFHHHLNENISRARHDSLVRTLRRTCRLEIWG
jgi:FkbM family methyltransferase